MSTDQIKENFGIDEFEIIRTGFGNFPILTVSSSAGQYNSAEAVTTIAHGLGYTPTLMVNISFLSGTTTQGLPCPYENNQANASAAFWGILQAYVDKNNIYLLSDMMVYGNATGQVLTGYVAEYFLLKQRAKRITGSTS
jgi:hypothetical protein